MHFIGTKRGLLAAASVLALVPATAKAGDLYDSIAAAIDSVEAQATVSIQTGNYLFNDGGVKVVWHVDRAEQPTLRFRYAVGNIQIGSIDFGRGGTIISISGGGQCANVKLYKLTVGPGGAVIPDQSNFQLLPPSSSCRIPRSDLETVLPDLLGTQIDPRLTFKGFVFAGQDQLKRCGDVICSGDPGTLPAANPVTSFSAFSTDGPQSTHAFRVAFKEGASLTFPNNAGFVKLAQGSQVAFAFANYNTLTKVGKANLQTFQANVANGLIDFGSATLGLGAGSQLSFSNLYLNQADGTTTATDGSLQGTIASGSSLALSNGAHKSIISFSQATASLTGLNFSFGKQAATLSAAGGRFDVILTSADLFPSDNSRLQLGPSNISVVFSCPAAEGNCVPASWGSDGKNCRQRPYPPKRSEYSWGLHHFSRSKPANN